MIKSSKILSHLGSEEEEDEFEENYNNKIYFKNIDFIETDTELRVGDIAICRCAAHTAQLVALDTSKSAEIKQYIINCRNVVKVVRKNSNGYREVFEIKGLKLPRLDCPTRWGSTYTMILDIQIKEILQSIESIVDNNDEANFEINTDFWCFVDSYCLALSPLQKAIVKFQAEQLHYGDFYAQWLKCKLLTQKMIDDNKANRNSLSYKLSFILLESIEKRTVALMSNQAVPACLYLDPRFQHLLTHTQRDEAVIYLKKLWIKFTSVCMIDKNDFSITAETTTANVDVDDDEDILNSFLNEEFNANNAQNEDVCTKIEKLCLPYVKSSTNILEFWKERKHIDSELYALSNICFGIPPTQVSVERAFSTLKLVLADNRNRLTHENLENILLVKLHPDFLDEAISELDLFADEDTDE